MTPKAAFVSGESIVKGTFHLILNRLSRVRLLAHYKCVFSPLLNVNEQGWSAKINPTLGGGVNMFHRCFLFLTYCKALYTELSVANIKAFLLR